MGSVYLLGDSGPEPDGLSSDRERGSRAFPEMTRSAGEADRGQSQRLGGDPDAVSRDLLPVSPEGSKVARASAVSPLIEHGNVYLPHPVHAARENDFIEECAAFPGLEPGG